MVSELTSALQDISAGNGFFISVLQKLNLFQLKPSDPGTIDEKLMDLNFRKNNILKCCDCISPLNWIGALRLLKLTEENWSLDLFYEVYFFWGCSLSLQINHTALRGILSYLGQCFKLLFGCATGFKLTFQYCIVEDYMIKTYSF